MATHHASDLSVSSSSGGASFGAALGAPSQRPGDGLPLLRPLAQIEGEDVSWLWPMRIPLGKLTMLVGDPGVGKSYLTAELAARVSRGSAWPDHAPGNGPGDSIFMMCEDDPADTLRPRLEAQGADLTRVHVLDGHRSLVDGQNHFTTLDTGLDVLARALRSVDRPRMVVIDPITAYMGRLDANNNSEVRGLMSRLSNLARRFRVAIVLVSHLNKDSGNTRTVYRTMGALSFCAAARCVYFVKKEAQSLRVVVPAKHNLKLNHSAMTYTILDDGTLSWQHTDLAIAAEDVESDEAPVSLVEEAVAWLRSLLSQGPRAAREVQQLAGEDGIAIATLRRAMRIAGVQSRREKEGWMWVLGT